MTDVKPVSAREPVATISPRLPRSAPARLRSALKTLKKGVWNAYARVLFPFTPADLEAALRKVGVDAGDVVCVHCSYDAFRAFSGRPSDVVEVLQRLVGAKGVVMMPTMPFTGTAVDWAAAHPTVDLRRTPSRMGLVSELFRRSPGVLRSIHPTHPVAAWGERAGELIANHAQAKTPCGEGSPYHQLLEHDGRIVFLGADVTSLTFFHTVEALLADQWPASPFTREEFRLSTLAADGSAHTTLTRLFDPKLSRRRNLEKLMPEFAARGTWRETKVGLLRISAVRARDVLDAVAALAARGIYAYDNYP